MSYDKDNDNNNNSNNSNNINYYRGDSWMSYDNERSVALKAEFAYDAGLAGVRPFLLRNKKSYEEHGTIFIYHHQIVFLHHLISHGISLVSPLPR